MEPPPRPPPRSAASLAIPPRSVASLAGSSRSVASLAIPPRSVASLAGSSRSVASLAGSPRNASSIAGVHRRSPRPPLPPLPPSASAVVTPSRNNPQQQVSLRQPRPGQLRASNIYTLPPGATPAAPQTLPDTSLRRHQEHSACCPDKLVQHRLQEPVVLQPTSLLKTKKPTVEDHDDQDARGSPSFVCEQCGRCRCAACGERRRLPQTPLLCCAGPDAESATACVLSADCCVDWASCLCCVKAIGYHCCAAPASDSGSRTLDSPCSCSGGSRCRRWTALTALSLLMPCLCCYWPLRGCVRLAEHCAGRGSSRGCRCHPERLLT